MTAGMTRNEAFATTKELLNMRDISRIGPKRANPQHEAEAAFHVHARTPGGPVVFRCREGYLAWRRSLRKAGVV